jgi:hypothetical protein
MKTFNEFHDGFVEGVLLDRTSAFVFFRNWKEDRVVMKLDDVRSLKMNNFRQGNILFDVIARDGNEISHDDIEQLFGFSDDSQVAKKLAETDEEQLVVVEVNPSYGASFLAIAKSFRTMSRKDWLDEIVTTEKSLGS